MTSLSSEVEPHSGHEITTARSPTTSLFSLHFPRSVGCKRRASAPASISTTAQVQYTWPWPWLPLPSLQRLLPAGKQAQEQLRPPHLLSLFLASPSHSKSLVAASHLELFWKIDFLVCPLTRMVLALLRYIPCLCFIPSLDALRNLLNWTPNKQRSSKSECLNNWYVSENRRRQCSAYLWAYLVQSCAVGS